MDLEQAKSLLSAKDGAEDDALLEQAIAQLERDPELAEWFAAQMPSDEDMRAAVRGILPPSHLRESILAAAKAVPFPAQRTSRFLLGWMAAAAAIVLALGAAWFSQQPPSKMSFAQLDKEIPRLTAAHDHGFGSADGDIIKIKDWLASHGGETNLTIPAGLTGQGGIACEVASVDQTKVSILCFELGGGRTAHLYVVDRSQLADPPAEGAPAIRELGDFAVASWSQGNQTYVLAQQGGTDSLRKLL